MKTRKWFFFGSFILSVSIILTGCPIEYQEQLPPPIVLPEGEPLEGIPDGTGTGTGHGFASSGDPNWFDYNAELGLPITVTVTVLDRFITEVSVSGPDETHGWGTIIMDQAPAIVKTTNRFELEIGNFVNAVTMSTATINGVNQAGNNALADIVARYGAGE